MLNEKAQLKPGKQKLICDICGRQVRKKDVVFGKDKYSGHYKLLMCRKHYDGIDPQLAPIRLRAEKQVKDPKFLRPDIPEADKTTDWVDTIEEIEAGKSSSVLSGNAPSAPKNLKLDLVLSDSITLRWGFPDANNGGGITGYKIERESPVGGGFSTLVANTNAPYAHYEDTTVSASTQYNYRVSAINRSGTSSASNEASGTTGA